MKELSPVPAVIRPVNRFLIVAALRHIHECVGRGSTGGSSGGGGGGGVTKYAVAVSPADNGKVTSDKTRAAKDSVVTITTKANDGYALDTIKATDKAGKEIKLTDKGDGKYTFTMPASKVEVKAAFKQTASKPDKPAEEMKTVVVMQIGSKTMFVNGKAYEKDAAPVIMNDRTLVPIRFVTESLGGTVAWNAETKEVTLVIDGKEIKMTIGKTIEKYGVALVIIDSRTFVPVRFVADELGATTAWNAETKTVTITKAVTPVKTEK
ncbi:MAG: stalk domain-containing protein [Anaerotignum faecicola]